MKKMLVCLLMVLSSAVYSSEGIEVKNAVVRMTPPGMTVSAMFMELENTTSKDVKLVKVSSDFAQSFELHNMEMKDSKMQMRAVDSILLPRNSVTTLKSGGFHIMIFDIKKSLKIGDKFKIRLLLDSKKELTIEAVVKSL